MRVLDRIRSNSTGRVALKIGVGILGGVVVAIGLLLLVFPGPGWPIIFAGLAIWAIEFAWAKHLLTYAKRHVTNWTHWVGRQSLLVRGVIAVLSMVFLTALVWVSVKVSFDVDLLQVALDLVDKW
ncbi:TIGR02611 family protein [Actinoplanes sp. NPDC023801]|uniref:TIGR02611 family protein n=1 Tax=Actinoplanes sp. NPDC023801 TaxID=3154595 RepID=UPI0033D41A5E